MSSISTRRKKKKLAASFVVTIAVGAAGASTLEGCKKQSVDDANDPNIYRVGDGTAGNVCFFSYPEHCPRGAMCNPPPPQMVDCPPDLRDAAVDPPGSPRRPVGKEDWIRFKPVVYPQQNNECVYQPEHFCPPKGKSSATCTEQPPQVKVACSLDQDSGLRTISSFVYRDGLGECRKVPESPCNTNMRGSCFVPDGEVVPCPK